jgi:hypothetical protein
MLHGITLRAAVAGGSSSSMIACSTPSCDVTLLHSSCRCNRDSTSVSTVAPSGWSGLLLCDGSSAGDLVMLAL